MTTFQMGGFLFPTDPTHPCVVENLAGLRSSWSRGSGKVVQNWEWIEHSQQSMQGYLGGLSRSEMIALAGQLGIIRTVRSRQDALAAILRWVYATPLARLQQQY